jgi:hypothetical protein
VSGAPVAPTLPKGGGTAAALPKGGDLVNASLAAFSSAVNATLPGVMVNGMAPIVQMHEAMQKRTGMSLDQFKTKLVEAYKADKIDLARNDLGVDRYSSSMLKQSETDMGYGRIFVFVRRMS